MAIRRTSSNSISNAVKLSTGFASAAIPNTPTIGVATAVSDVAATVAYTAAVLGATASTFTATSSPGSVTGTGSSPITVTGLTASTSYTFTVTAGNANGTSAASSASNSITTSAPLSSYYSIASYTVPSNTGSVVSLTSIDQSYKDLVIIIAAGATYGGSGGGSGGRLYFNNDLTSGNYYWNEINGNGNGTTGGISVYGTSDTNIPFGALWAGNNNKFMMQIFTIYDYANTNKSKSIQGMVGATLLDGGNGTNSGVGNRNGIYVPTTAINSIHLHHGSATGSDGDLAAGSQINIFGVKG